MRISDVLPDRDGVRAPQRPVQRPDRVLHLAGTAKQIVARARALIAPFGNGGAYPNYADLALRNPQRAYYGQNLPRLRQIKGQVDPDGRFTTAQGIG